MPDDRPVLLCTDGSEVAQAAIVRACEFLAPGPAEALSIWMPAPVLHPHTKPAAILEYVLLEPAATVDTANERAAEEAAQAAAAAARAAGFDCETRCDRTEDPAWRAILARADEIDAEAIVIGSHGRSGLDERLLGGVAHRVVSHADRPIVLIPPPGRGR